MKKKEAAREAFPPRSVRLDPELIYRAELLVAKNKRDKRDEKTIGLVLNAALDEYLKKRGA